MSDYLFIVKVAKEIESELIITSIEPQSYRFPCADLNIKLAFYKQNFDSCVWKFLGVKKFSQGFIKATSEEFNLKSGEIVVAVPLKDDYPCNEDVEQLPAPVARRNSRFGINERSTVRFIYNGCRTSYQGEYPWGMAQVGIGKMFSMPSMLKSQNQTEKLQSIIVLVNIYSRKISSKISNELILLSCDNHKVIQKTSFKLNGAALMVVDGALSTDCYLISKSAIGIPLYFTFIKNQGSRTNISLEHSHPPAELFFGDCKHVAQRNLKQNWFEAIARSGDE